MANFSYSDYQKFNLLLPKMGALVDEVEYAEYNMEDCSLNRCSIDGGIVQVR